MGREEASVIGRGSRNSVSFRTCSFRAATPPEADPAAIPPPPAPQHQPVLQAQAASLFRLEGVTFAGFGNIYLFLDTQATSRFFSDEVQPVWKEEAGASGEAEPLEAADAAGAWLTADDGWLREVQKV